MSRLVVVLRLSVILIMASIAALSSLSLADDNSDFDPAEGDPELPALIKKWNGDCLSCHSQDGLANPPRQGMDMDLLAKLLIQQRVFEGADHKKMACKDCHGEAYVPYPHLPEAKTKIKSCESCHQMPAQSIVPEFRATAHFKEHRERFTCLACHNPHTMRTGSRLGPPKDAAAEDNKLCRTCHDDDRRYGDFKPQAKRPDLAAAHDWLPEQSMHLARIRCIDCHTPLSSGTLSHDVQGKEKAVRRCELCHSPDTELGRRLFKRTLRDNPEPRNGFINAALLDEVYVVGANRNLWLERAAIAALAATGLAMAAHAIRRRLKSAKRRVR